MVEARSDDVLRRGLLDRFPRPEDARRLLVVSAPGGWGKTTLVRSWADRVPARCSWSSLSAADNDPVRLIASVLSSARSIAPDINQSLPDPGSSTPAAWVEENLPVLMEAIQAESPAAIVLDDYHLIENPESHSIVQAMVEQVGSRSLLVLSTRVDPPLRLARLRAARWVDELRSEDLGFSVDDADLVLRQAFSLELTRPQLQLLVESTEGWPAAISLAAQSLKTVDDRDAFLAQFVTNDRLIVDYLAEELLDTLPPDHQTFVHRTSVVDQFGVELASALADPASAGAIAEDLERRGLVRRRHESGSVWYRYHDLLRDVLVHRLDEDTKRAGHRLAADWFLDHGHPRRAIEQLIAAGDNRRAIALVAEHASDYTLRGRYTTVARWISALADAGEADPGMFLLAARAALYGGRVDQAKVWADRAGESAAEYEPHERLMARAAKVSLLHANGRIADAATEAERVFELFDSHDGAFDGPSSDVAECLLVSAMALTLTDRIDQAEIRLQQCIEMPSETGDRIPTITAISLQGLLAFQRHEPDTARTLTDRAMQMADEAGLPSTAIHMSLAHVGRLLTGDVEQAKRAVEPLRTIGEKIYSPYAVVLFHLAEANHWIQIDSTGDAQRVILAARDLSDEIEQPSPLIERYVDLVASRLPSAPETTDGDDLLGPGALTARELQVLRAFSSNLTQREIGRELFLSFNTVKTYARSAYRKLGVTSRSEAVKACREAGLF